jgi:DNA-binding transcriptional LysR family regulator
MVSITPMNLSALDLNLLHVLAVVLEERSATKAARRLHVTQPAVSNALARLRAHLGDPLVVKQGRGLVPTPLAERLYPALQRALSDIERAVQPAPPFDPRTCEREFVLASADAQQLSDLPLIARALAARMPRATLRVVSIDVLLATDGLATGEIDAALSVAAAHPGLPSQPLYDDDGVALLRSRHPFRGKILSRAAFSRLPHVALNVALGRTGVGHAMAERAFRAAGLERRIALTVPSFVAAAAVVAMTDHVVCMPRRVATSLSAQLPVRVVLLPLPPLTLGMSLVWHPKNDVEPAQRSFRALITEVLGPPRARGRRRGT